MHQKEPDILQRIATALVAGGFGARWDAICYAVENALIDLALAQTQHQPREQHGALAIEFLKMREAWEKASEETTKRACGLARSAPLPERRKASPNGRA